MWKLLLVGLGLAAGLQAHAFSRKNEWWQNSIIYQVYPRSFKDSDGDGIGDLNGITSKLEHIRDTGAAALWLSPIFESPQVDFGYDISNFTNIDPIYGTLSDFRRLISKARSLGIKVLLDLVPNHSSDQHVWFAKSVNRVKPFDDYYIWRDGKRTANGTVLPPNNWRSIFGGSAWTWSDQRKQFYYHQFASAQPDLNYRNPKVQSEMEKIIEFWLDEGVDGFRIDAIIHMFEDIQLRDEPLSNKPGVKPDEYDYLEHLYTKDQNETYDVVARWRQIMDQHAVRHDGDLKYAIVEAGSPIPLMMRYYEVGVDPFNFMFIAELRNHSRPVDYQRTIMTWLDNMPKGKTANWVVGNHDSSRVASRFGYNGSRADQIPMLAGFLPGITVIYNGDEIGMRDRPMSYEETVDPAGCNLGEDRYYLKSRDPARTPFQWDATVSAGFSTNPKTWLPVHENYKWLNLAAQKKAGVSHFKVFQQLAKLKKTLPLQDGRLEVLTRDDRILGIVNRLPDRAATTAALLINLDEAPVKLDLRSWLRVPDSMRIHVANVRSNLKINSTVGTGQFLLPGAASVVLVGNSSN